MLPLLVVAGAFTRNWNRCTDPRSGLTRSSKSSSLTGSLNGFASCTTNTTAGHVAASAGS